MLQGLLVDLFGEPTGLDGVGECLIGALSPGPGGCLLDGIGGLIEVVGGQSPPSNPSVAWR